MHRDPSRSYESIDLTDLERLGRVADTDLQRFFARNPHRAAWRQRVGVIALAQGGAEHYLRGERGIRDLDVIVCFCAPQAAMLRRQVVTWDWGPSKFGTCPYDPAYTGRPVDVKLWVIPKRNDPVDALREWLALRLGKWPDVLRKPDVAQEPVILIRPTLGLVAWDPGAPPLPGIKTSVHRPPAGLAPP